MTTDTQNFPYRFVNFTETNLICPSCHCHSKRIYHFNSEFNKIFSWCNFNCLKNMILNDKVRKTIENNDLRNNIPSYFNIFLIELMITSMLNGFENEAIHFIQKLLNYYHASFTNEKEIIQKELFYTISQVDEINVRERMYQIFNFE